ncbi:MAG TPA: hypothetical protein VLC92_09630 [Rhodocyclaceae bacterium]|nr:hypothetical protein [Rhodocyclaceae bacterium]
MTTDNSGRFTSGNAAKSPGRPRGMTAARKLDRLLTEKGAALLERAFDRAEHDDAVLAALLSVIASAEVSGAVARFGFAAAQAPQGDAN